MLLLSRLSGGFFFFILLLVGYDKSSSGASSSSSSNNTDMMVCHQMCVTSIIYDIDYHTMAFLPNPNNVIMRASRII